jgi:phosphoglycerol transferase MdoB-like AlkP superfamily enzyme
MNGMIIGGRAGPDMRYFIPAYFLGGFIGLYPIIHVFKQSIERLFQKYYILLFMSITSISSLIIIIFEPLGGPGDGYRIYHFPLILLLSSALILISVFYQKKRWLVPITCIILILLISIPIIWQFIVIYYFSIGRFNGYPFWSPYLEYLYEMYVPYSWK